MCLRSQDIFRGQRRIKRDRSRKQWYNGSGFFHEGQFVESAVDGTQIVSAEQFHMNVVHADLIQLDEILWNIDRCRFVKCKRNRPEQTQHAFERDVPCLNVATVMNGV